MMEYLTEILWNFNADQGEKGVEMYFFNGYKYSLESSLLSHYIKNVSCSSIRAQINDTMWHNNSF